ncbi:MAG: HU family DNA-binding protein [Candidatus Sedimenticola sp. (ex Thyasira tokunagai)]
MAVKKRAAKKSVAKKAPAAKKKVVAKKRVAAKKKVAVKKKVTARKKVAAKTAAAPARAKSITTRQTKTQIIQQIAEDNDLTRKQVADVFGSLGSLIQRHMQRRGSGEFSIPETGVKIRRVKKPARKARMGRNPATGETIKIAAKKATTVVKVSALKALKDTLV